MTRPGKCECNIRHGTNVLAGDKQLVEFRSILLDGATDEDFVQLPGPVCCNILKGLAAIVDDFVFALLMGPSIACRLL